MDSLTGQRIEIRGHGRDQRLSFAGLHLGNHSAVKGSSADHLDVVVALAKNTFGSFANDRESLHLEVVERLARDDSAPELGGFCFQLLVGQSLKGGLGIVDRSDDPLELLEGLAFSDPKDLGEDWH